MAITEWAIQHPHHDVVGPRFCKPGTLLNGLEMRVDRDHGITDMRLCFVNPDGSEPDPPRSDWITHYAPNRETSLTFDAAKEYAVGLIVRERRGAGIVDLRLILKSRKSGEDRFTDWALNVPDASERAEIRFADGAEMIGFAAKEHSGEGIVDIKLIA